MKKYETVVILDERKVQDEGKAFAEEFATFVSAKGGIHSKTTFLGRKMFAREINKRKYGLYIDFWHELPESAMVDLPAKYRLDERVLRLQTFIFDRVENAPAKAVELDEPADSTDTAETV